MNNTITEIKNTLEVTSNGLSEAEDWISMLEERIVEKTEAEQNKQKRIKRNEDILKELWDNIKGTNIRILCAPEEEQRTWYDKIFEDIIVKNFFNMRNEPKNPIASLWSLD